MGTAALFLIWLVAVIVLKLTEVRPTQITDYSITLTGVSRDFIDAVDRLRDERRAQRRLLEGDDWPDEKRRREPRNRDDDRVQRPHEDEEDNRYQR